MEKITNSRAYVVDLIHSIGEKLALCDHLAEKLDEENVKNLYLEVVNERRAEMKLLVSCAENPNLEYWCSFKHALKSWTLAVEVYDAKPSDETLKMVEKSENILAGIISLFLGMEFEPCARCLYDKLLFENN